VAFQPHRFTRTRDLLKDFAPALRSADEVVLTDIYAAGEAPIDGITIERVLATFPAGSAVTYLARNGLAESLLPRLRAGDLLLTLGAGDITQVGSEILGRLAKS
jgi:UDP-N-acetylmuramate--alanine ligase